MIREDRGLWPEVALDAEQTREHVLARRGVEADSAATGTGEVERDLARVVLRLEARVHQLETDIEVRHRVPDGTRADVPDVEVGIAARQSSSAARCNTANRADRALLRRAEQRLRSRI